MKVMGPTYRRRSFKRCIDTLEMKVTGPTYRRRSFKGCIDTLKMKVAGSTYRRREYDRVSFGPTVCTVKTQRSRCADVVVDIALGAFKHVVRSNGMYRKDSTIAVR